MQGSSVLLHLMGLKLISLKNFVLRGSTCHFSCWSCTSVHGICKTPASPNKQQSWSVSERWHGLPEVGPWARGWIPLSWVWRQRLVSQAAENEEVLFLKFPWDYIVASAQDTEGSLNQYSYCIFKQTSRAGNRQFFSFVYMPVAN